MRKRVCISLLALLMVCMSIPWTAWMVCAEETEANTETTVTSQTLLWPVPGHKELLRGYHEAKAIDIGDDHVDGAQVVAACSGTVTDLRKCSQQHAGNTNDCANHCYGLGTAVIILGDDGRFYQYAHLQGGSIPSDVRVNSKVKTGQMLGYVGATGDAEVPHLHFGITTGTAYAWSYINPEKETYVYDAADLPADNPEQPVSTDQVPSNAKIELARSEYNVSEKITVKASADNASYYYGMILKNGKSVWSGPMTDGEVTYQASQYGTGTFSTYAICSNEYGMVGTPVKSFKVTDTYVFPFTDVSADDWFYSWIKLAHQKGLIAGMSSSSFEPNGTMTYAQAITLAARLHQNYYEGKSTLVNGTENWYDTYVQYCYQKGIISESVKNYGPNRMNNEIDRATYVGFFAKAMPSKEFVEKNTIPSGSIPDVTQATVNREAIYMFYRAGILNGSDAKGSFKPYSSIKRSEVAAILVRMVDASYRVGAPSELEAD